MKLRKEYRPLLAACRDAGWEVRKSKNGLLAYPPAGGRPIPFHGTPAVGNRSLENMRSQLRRAGLEV